MLTRSKEIINGLSKQLEAELQEKFDSLPKKIKYAFDVSRRNPDPTQVEGPVIYPAWFELSPVTFFIKDPYDKQTKKIGLVTEEDNEGRPSGFKRIVLKERDRGIKYLDKDEMEAFDTFCYLELHPAQKGTKWRNEGFVALFNRVDESKEAKGRNSQRKLKASAMYVADNMSTQEEKDFACAMGWDEDMDSDVLHGKIGEMAEDDPETFRDFIESKSLEYKATVKRAEDHGIIEWNALEYKYSWSSTKEVLIAFDRQENMDRLERMAEWLLNKKEIYDKLKALLKAVKIHTK